MNVFQNIWDLIWNFRNEISIWLGILSVVFTTSLFILKYTREFYIKVGRKKDAMDKDSISKKCYYWYEKDPPELTKSNELAEHLAYRYTKLNSELFDCSPFEIYGKKFPAFVLWQNNETLSPNAILLNKYTSNIPTKFTKSLILDESDYKKARQLIKTESEKGKIKDEYLNYRMTRIDLINYDVPKIDGELGWYYDNKLTQYAIEWELNKALNSLTASNLHTRLCTKGALPLREAVELTDRNPILYGYSRCTTLTLSALIMFQDRGGDYQFILSKRAQNVGASPNLMHVVPSGMAEPFDNSFKWDLEYNFWREFMEELYNVHEYHFQENRFDPNMLYNAKPINEITLLLKQGKAHFSITGICTDLLNLRPEICMILLVDDKEFLDIRQLEPNWESSKDIVRGNGFINWRNADREIELLINKPGFVVSGIICYSLACKWLCKNRPDIFALKTN